MDQTGNVMNKQPIVLLVGCFVLGMGIQAPAVAQEVALRAGVISAGAGVSATGDNRLRSTVGAPGPGILSGSDHTLYGGFWFVAHPPTGPLALPVLSADAVVTDEDVAVIIAPLENDIDPAGGPLAITSFTQPDNGIVEQIADSQLTYTPDPDFNGQDEFTYTATNGQGGSSTAIVTVTILPVNDPPQFASDPVTVASAGQRYSYLIEAYDVDGDPLTIGASTLPAWLSILDNRDGTAMMEGTPTNADAGKHEVVLEASDGVETTEQGYEIEVLQGVPSAPVLTAPEDGSIDVPTDVTFTWDGVPGAATYELQLSTVEDFSSTMIDTTGLATTSLDVPDLLGGATYFWRVRAVNSTGPSPYAGPFGFTTISNVGTDAEQLPNRFFLDQNYPNPFNPSTTIAYELPSTTMVRLVVYNVFGHEVATLVNGTMAAGRHEASLESGGIASGVYLYRIEAGDFTAVRHMLLIK